MLLALRQRDAKRRKTVLVLSGDIALISMLKCTLSMEGFDVREAGGLKDAASEMDSALPDLAITDISHPENGQLSFMRGIRNGEVSRSIPVLVIAAEADLVRQMEWRAAGATCWITKPFTTAQLMEMVETMSFSGLENDDENA